MKIFSKNTWGVDVNNAWPLTCKASCLKKIELRPLISGFDFALLEVRNLGYQTTRPADNSDRDKSARKRSQLSVRKRGLVGPYVKTTRTV